MDAIRKCKFLQAFTGCADSEGNEHRSRSCKIAALGIGGKDMASPGGAAPLEIGEAVWPGQGPMEDLKSFDA